MQTSLQVAVAIALMCAPVRGQIGTPSAGSTQILGTVRVEGTERPVPGARVALRKQGLSVLTDSLGRFALVDVRPGLDTLVVSTLQFASRPLPILVRESATHRVELSIPIPMATLEELTVTARTKRRRAADRIAKRMAIHEHGFTAADVAARQPALLTDMFRGLKRVDARGGKVRLHSRAPLRARGRSGLCEPLLYIDGFPQYGRTVDSVNPDVVFAVEILQHPYIPPRYTVPFASCGSVLIWTKTGYQRGG